MYAFRLRAAALALTAAAGLSACTTPYGYSGVSLGVGNGYYGSSYGGYGYGYPDYGYGYGYPASSYRYSPFGWYDDYYYPGTGFYVYDSYRRPHRWTDAQRRYWTVRREQALTTTTTRPIVSQNWSGFSRDRVVRPNRIERSVSRPVRVERVSRPAGSDRSVDRVSRPARVDRSVERAETKSTVTARQERRSEIRASSATDRSDRKRGNREE
jgi:hypothetical protein